LLGTFSQNLLKLIIRASTLKWLEQSQENTWLHS